jgi:hypothetical protein
MELSIRDFLCLTRGVMYAIIKAKTGGVNMIGQNNMYDIARDSVARSVAMGWSVSILIFLTVSVVMLVARWKLYQKAGREGWESIIPIYSSYVLYDIAMGNGILFLLGWLPIVNYVMYIVLYVNLAKSFGKDVGYMLGLIFLNPIFLCILAFGDAEYVGPQGTAM